MKMRGMKNETNGSAKQASKVVSDGQTTDVLLFCIEFLNLVHKTDPWHWVKSFNDFITITDQLQQYI